MWVKGSGGDLATLTDTGLAVLRLDRLRALVDVYPGVEREDEMVDAFDYCLHGKGGAAPSIDTAMHGLVDAPHVDHLHPDSGIAIAAVGRRRAADQGHLRRRVLWVPWRRPGFQLGLDIAAMKEANPEAIGVILGGHGITAWGDTSDEAEANSRWIIADGAGLHRRPRPSASRSGRPSPSGPPLPPEERRARAAALAPHLRAVASRDHVTVGHFDDSDVVLDFLAGERLHTLAELGTSCPDHFLRTKVKPLVVDLPSSASVEEVVERLAELHETYRADYAAYYQRHATARLAADAGRRPRRSSSCRASGCSPTASTSRPRGWPASSTSTPST